jgi:hypothetical protein
MMFNKCFPFFSRTVFKFSLGGNQPEQVRYEYTFYCATLGSNETIALAFQLPLFDFDQNEWMHQRGNIKYTCPTGNAICGMKSQGSVINLQIACCEVRDPASFCKPKYAWVEVLSCSRKLSCKVKFTTALQYSTQFSEKSEYEYEFRSSVSVSASAESPFKFEDILGTLETTFTREIGTAMEDHTEFSQVFSKAKQEGHSFEIDASHCTGTVKQLILTCGVYEIATSSIFCE